MSPKKSKKKDEPKDTDVTPGVSDEEPLKVGKVLLIIGLLLCAAGIIGVLGLRAGFIQSLLGDAAPYPGIGTAEPMGHIVSVIPIVMGLVTIFVWGIKNDPIYYELEKQKEETFDFEEPEETELEETLVPVGPTMDVPEEFKEPLESVDETIEKLLEDEDEILEEGSTMEGPEPELPEKKPVKKVPSKAAAAFTEAEEDRVARCEKMVTRADISPEDKKRLRYLIPTGISPSEFTQEVMKAMESKKKKESEKELSSEEKALLLEEELAEELAELEEELGSDEDDDDLEDKILQEIEDLENL